MGLFDSIYAEVECPATKTKEKQEIQIKWSQQRSLRTYKIGDVVDLDNKNTLWVKEDYVCNSCSRKTRSKFGDFIKVVDQQRHDCYIHIKNNKILEILTENEFSKTKNSCINPDNYEF